MGGCRFTIAGGALCLVLRALGARAPTATEWRHAAVTGVLMASLGNGLVTLAEEHIPSNFAALLIACVPLHVALLEWLRPGGKRPSAAVLFGVVVGFAGMLLLVAPAPGHAVTTDTWGVLAVLGSGLAWALGIVYSRHQTRHPNALLSSGQQMLVGGVVLLVASLLRGEIQSAAWQRIHLEGVLALTYLTLFGSIIAFSSFTWLVGFTAPSKISTVAYVNPVVAVLLGWWILDETLQARALWGALLIVGAVALMSVDFKALRARWR
jgi:drug/metabolite transporter (DMT)-like permease